MKNTITYNTLFAIIIALCCCSLSAQNSESLGSEHSELIADSKRQDNFNELKQLGYNEREIYEDLGNANFLSKNYDTAVFWYTKLFEYSDGTNVSKSYYERYHYALQMTNQTSRRNIADQKDWIAAVKADYGVQETTNTKYRPLDFNMNQKSKALVSFVENETKSEISSDSQHDFKSQIAVTADGNTAYYTKAIYVKPLYGVFSKKELLHKIYKAVKISGQWKTTNEVAVCPKNSSSMHPTVSEDGKRLFFASDMPGTFGKFDIYVADIHSDGTYGVAKNLGQKVNTIENDLYPNIVGGTSLFFASNGHKGYGGLDVFMVEVANNKVGWTVNLGSPINTSQDDFSIDLLKEKGVGYVLLNRGKDQGDVQRVAYTYTNPKKDVRQDRKDYNILEALNSDSKINYSTSVFEDK